MSGPHDLTNETPRARRRWSDAEEETLRNCYGLMSDAALARRLGRSQNALNTRARVLGLRKSDTYYSASRAAAALGVGGMTVAAWIRAGLLVAHRAPTKKGNRGRPWCIRPQALERFVRAHPERLDFRRLPNNVFRKLLRRVAPPDQVSVTLRRWTPADDAYLLNNRGRKSQPTMARELCRTPNAVHYRISYLRQAGRLVPYCKGWGWRWRVENGAGAARVWTEAEDNFIREHYGRPRSAGQPGDGSWWTAARVGAVIGRSVSAVATRAGKLGVCSRPGRPPRPAEQEAI